MNHVLGSEIKKGISNSPSAYVDPAQITQLEKLIREFSSRIAGSPTSAIAEEIRWGLRKMVECLDVDRCALWEVRRDCSKQARRVYDYTAPEIGHLTSPIVSLKDFPWIFKKVKDTEAVFFSRVEELPKEASADKESFRAKGIKSALRISFRGSGKIISTMLFTCRREEKQFQAELIPLLKLAGEIIISALHRKQMEEKFESTLLEIQKTSKLVNLEDRDFGHNPEYERAYINIIGKSTMIQNVFSRVEQVASTDSLVLVQGETGTGKGLIARAIHELSPRRNRMAVTVNCAALPSSLIESELFGREKGAFTGSSSRQVGRFELADKSTLILDEIAELSPELQAKLLRVIQDAEFERLGSPKTIKVDVRIIAITSKDLKAEILKGRFRQELYYRLNVFPIASPPLRERYEDIPLLVDHFVRIFSRKMQKEIQAISPHMMRALNAHTWPGNVRELEHVIERAIIMSEGSTLRLTEKLEDASLSTDEELSITNLAEVERRHILRILEKTKWRIEGSIGAAILLGLHPNTLRGRMRKLGISVRRSQSSHT
jgi:formate hydrogenlyase transcriptional activator